MQDASTNGGTSAFSSATETADQTVTAVNDAPSGTDNTLAMLEDGEYTFAASDFGFNDIEGDAFDRIFVDSLPTLGQLLYNGSTFAAGNFIAKSDVDLGLLSFRPASGANGTGYADFTFSVADDGGIVNGGIDRDQSPNTITFDVTAAYRIEGNVLEDVNGDSSLADAVGAGSVTVYLYQDADDDNVISAGDTLFATTTTDVNGSYSFASLLDDTYFVVVDSRTIAPSAGLNAGFTQTDVWAEQTYGVAGAASGVGFQPAIGSVFGGKTADVSDDASSLLTAEHVTRVTINAADASNIDSAFSFNVVTGVRDGDDAGGEGRSIQGSFRQFYDNANAIAGGNAMRFVPGVATNATDGSGNDWWTINLASNLVDVQDDGTIIDGTAYSSTDGTTVLDSNAGQIGTGGTVGLGADGMLGTGDDVTIAQFDRTELELVGVATDTYVITSQNDGFELRDVAIRKAANGTTNGGLVNLSGTNETLANSLIGVSADGTTYGATGPAGTFVYLQNSNATVQNNFFGYAGDGGISALGAVQANSANLIGNEVSGQFQFGFSAYGNNMTVSGNLIQDIKSGFGIGTFYGPYSGSVIENNTVRDTTGYAAIAAGYGSSNLTIQHNIIRDNSNGVVIRNDDGGTYDDAVNIVVSANSIYSTAGSGIEIDSVGVNDGVFDTTRPNDGIDHPIITNANLVGSNLTLTGYVGTAPGDTDFANARIEFFESDGGGEGQRYLGFTTTDANGNYSVTLAVTGVIDTDKIVATATMTGIGTSEFGNEFGVNVAPINTVPGTQSATEDISHPISGLSVGDADTNVTSVQLSVVNGLVSVMLQGSATISAGSIGSATLTISGTQTNINSTLATLQYKGNTNYNGSDSLTVVATDAGGLTDSDSFAINVAAANDAPLLDNSGNMTLTTISEDATTNGGNTVASILASATGDRVTDADSGSSEGIAITSKGSGNGTWQYSINAGSTWTAVGTVSSTQALLLRDIDLVRFVPNAQNGTTASIGFHAWDQTTGTFGTKANATTVGGTTAFSSATETADITVTSLNDAPVYDNGGTTTLATINEDALTNNGTLISTMIASAGGNRITDVDTGAVEGIAIITAGSTVGTWQYQLNGTSTWTNVGTVSATSSLLLRDTDSLRFVPNGQNGGTATLSFRAWDQTTGTVATKVSSNGGGGTSAFSLANEVGTITISSVNDAPTITNAATYNFAGTNEDTTGTMAGVSAILSTTGWADVDTGAVRGMAITGFTGSGTWQYSTNASAWNNFGTASATGSLLLDGNTFIRFVPNGQNGETATFSYRAWDTTTGTASTNTVRMFGNSSINGGDTAYSSNSATGQIVVTDVNDSPDLFNTSGIYTFNSINEDATNNAGQTVASVIATNAPGITDVDNGAVEGIAIRSISGGNGTWQYSINGGTSWSNVGTVSSTSALVLRDTDLLRYVPNGNSGTISNLTFIAWDRSDSSVAGTKVSTAVIGGTTAFSDEVAVARITVTDVNDAPDVTGPTAATVAESGSFTFEGSSLIDTFDVDGDDLTVTLTAEHAGIVLSQTTGLTFTDSDGSDGTLSFTGTQANIDAALDGLVFNSKAGYNGASSLTILASDGSLSDSHYVFVTVTPGTSTFVWDGGGTTNNWSDALNWDHDLVPEADDIVVFNVTSVKNATVDASFAGAVSEVQVAAAYTGTITQSRSLNVASDFSTAGGTYSFIGQTLNVDGNFTHTGGTSTWGSGRLEVAGNFVNSGSLSTGTSTIVFNGAGNQSYSNNGFPLSSIEINKASGTLTMLTDMSITGNFTHVSGGVDFGSTTLTVTGTTAKTINDGNIQLGNLNLNSIGAVTIVSALNVNENLTISNATTINGGPINVAGNVSLTDSSWVGSTTVVLNGTTNQTVTASGASAALTNLTINKASGTSTLTGNLNLSGSLLRTAGSVDATGLNLQIGGSTGGTIDGNIGPINNLTINTTGTKTIVNTLTVGGNTSINNINNLNGGKILATGNVALVDNLYAGTTQIELGGSANQTVTASTTGSMLRNAIINKSGGAVTFANSFTHTGTFTHTAGTVNMAGTTTRFTGTGLVLDTDGMAFNNVTFDSNATFSLTSDMTIGGNLTINSLAGNSLGNGHALLVAGNINSIDAFVVGDFDIVLNGTGNQTISGDDLGDGNIRINKASGVVTLLDDLVMTGSAKTLTVGSGTLDLNGHTVNSQGNVIIDTGTLTGSGDITSNLQLINGGIVRLDVTSNSVYDSIAIGGNAIITSGSLVLDVNGVTTGGLLNNLFTYTSGTGTFSSLTLANNSAKNYTAFDTYNANDYDVFLNTPPSGTIADVNVNEDAPNTVIDLAAAFADEEHTDAQLTYSVIGNTNAALFTSVSLNNAADTLTLDYADNVNGSADITVRVSDGLQSYDVTFTVTVNSVNDAPVGSDGTNVAVEDGSVVNGTLVASDNDPGDTLTFTLVSNTSEGSVTVNSNGSYSFDPGTDFQDLATGETRDVTFVYQVTDDGVGTLSDQATVTITVTGVNDAPVITDGPGSVALTETDAGLTSTGTLTVSDVDLTDVVTAAVDSVVVTGTGSSSVPVALDNAALQGFLSVTPTTILSGTQNTNTLTWNFNSGTEAFDFLATGETLVLTYTVSATDDDGTPLSDTETITITITGTNDAPVITDGPDSVALTETNAGLTSTGTLTVSDSDLTDVVNAAVDSVAVTGTGSGSVPVSLDNTTLQGFLSVTPTSILDGTELSDTLTWNFNSGSEAFNFLGAGETLILTYTVSATDNDGTPLSDAETVTITITGTNDGPDVFVDTGDRSSRLLTETNTTLTASETLTVTDIDTTDIVTSSVTGVTTSGTTTGLGSNNGDLLSMLSTTTNVVNSSQQTAKLTWNFNSASEAFNYLATGESLTLTYTVAIADGQGGTDTQTVTITINGTADAPVITDGPDTAALTETNTGLTSTGSLTVTDLDRTDNVTAAVDSVVVTGTGSGSVPVALDNAALRNFLTVSPTAILDGTETTNTLNWNFNSGSEAFDFLADGETLVLTYTVSATDDEGTPLSDTETVTVTITGTNDGPVAQAGTNTATEDGSVVNGTLTETDADTNDTHTYSLVTNTSEGSVTVQSNGNYAFDPGTDFQDLADGETRNVTFTYEVEDNNGATSQAVVTITVTGTNDVPVAQTGTNTAIEDGAIINGTLTETDADTNDTHTYSLIANTSEGSVTIQSNGNYAFDPGADFQDLAAGETRNVTFTYEVEDNNGATSQAIVTITVTGTNDGPVAQAGVNTAAEDGAVVTGQLTETDADTSDTHTYALITNTTEGTATVNGDGSYSFDPGSDFQDLAVGETRDVTFVYEVTDNNNATSQETITITVTGTNDAPVAQAGTNSAIEDGATVNGTLTETDADTNDTHTYALITGTSEGIATVNSNGSYSFDPGSDFQDLAVGETRDVTFVYEVNDNNSATSQATVTITVSGTNDGPVAQTGTNSATEDGATVNGTLTETDADTNDTHTYALITGTSEGIATVNSNGSYSFNPGSDFQDLAAGETRDVTFVYEVTDNNSATSQETVTITVTGTNDAPVAVVNSGAADEDGGINNATAGTDATGNVLTNDTDVDNSDTKTVSGVVAGTAASANGNVATSVTGTYGSIQISATGDYTYVINNSNADVQALRIATETLTDVFTYTVRDAAGATSSTQVAITIRGANDAPHSITAVFGNLDENSANGTSVGSFTGNDVDETDTLSYSLFDDASGRFSINPTTGEVTVANSNLLDYETATSHDITVRVTDASGSIYDRTVTINLNDVNEFNVTTPIDSDATVNSVNENAANGTTVGITALATDADATTNTVTYSLDDNANGRFAINPTTGVVTVANGSLLDREQATSHDIVVRATSSDLSSSTDTMTITVNDVNEFATTATTDIDGTANAVDENVAIGTTVGITASASDADGTNNAISYTLTNNPNGLFEIDVDSGIVTTAADIDREVHGASQSITVRSTSQDGSWTESAFTIDIADVNEFAVGPIVNNSGFTASINENSPTGTSAKLTALAIDQDSTDVVTYSLIDDAGGRFEIHANTGIVTLIGSVDFESESSHSIIVEATSSDGSTNDQAFTIEVIDRNEAPVAYVDNYSVNAGSTLTISSATGVIVNDNDIDGDPLTAYVITPTSNGTLTLQTDGRLTYTPSPGFYGFDTFTYIVDDGNLQSDSVEVRITVNAVQAPQGPDVPDGPDGPTTPTNPTTDPDSETNENGTPDGSGSPLTGPPTVTTPETEASTKNTVAGDRELALNAKLKLQSFERSDQAGTSMIYASVRESSQSRFSDNHNDFQSLDRPLLQSALQDTIAWINWSDSDEVIEESTGDLLVGNAGTAAGLFSIGYVLWALRGGAFVTAVATSLPSWRIIDPTALLSAYRATDDLANDELDDIIA
ncbi:MAG: VCBS domain-containing protein [Rubripirellula sp.]